MNATFERLTAQHHKLIQSTPTLLVRSLMHEIQWNSRLIGIKGSRGVGKTTLLLQFIKTRFSGQGGEALYVSLDSIWFAEHSLLDFADHFVKYGGKHLFLDEVHKYPNWSQELKNIYDSYPELQVVFTGSSLLDILNARADLSRRAVVYTLQGLSFREFLSLQTGHEFAQHTLGEILDHHQDIVGSIANKVKPLVHFDQYLTHGYFPFYFEQPDLYYQKLREVANMILEIELPLLRAVDIGYIPRVKQLLYIISQSVPFVPNVTKLSDKIGIQRTTLLSYLHYLDEVKLTKNLFKESGGISKLQKPRKIFLENTNLVYALGSENMNRGNLRETFFANQLAYRHSLNYAEKGDFLVDGTFTFEVGGKGKSSDQIAGLANAFIAADNIERGYQQKIPLWLFGFLY